MDVELPNEENCAKGTQHWPHAPPHRLSQAGVYFLTARCAGGRHLLADDEMKDWFQETLFTVAKEFGWTLEAWAILSNHYHLIGHSPNGPKGADSLRNSTAGKTKRAAPASGRTFGKPA